MNTKTLVVAVAIIAATASLALAPTFTTTALAAKGGVNPGGSTECVHNGNLRTTDGPCENPSGTTVVTCKVHGKAVPEDPNDDDEVCP